MKTEIAEVIKSEDLKDISIDIVESVIDNQIVDEVLKEIPIVKSLIAIKNIFNSISDKIFIKKAMNVLLELGEISPEERIEFLEELNDNFNSGSEKILLSIEKLDSYEKCQVFGRLAKLKAKNVIDTNNFLRLTKTIQDAYLDDLYMIKWLEKDKKNNITEEEFYPLISLGLIYQERSEQKEIRNNHQYNEYDSEFVGGEIEFYFYLTNTGKVLHDLYDDLFP
jgi:hypothetical protein